MENKTEKSLLSESAQVFRLISQDASIKHEKKLIIFELMDFTTKIQDEPSLSLEFEKWKLQNQVEPLIKIKAHNTFFTTEKDRERPKLKPRFRRGSSTSNEKKPSEKVPLIHLSSSFSSDKNISYGRQVSFSSSPLGSPKTSPSDSMESPSTRNTSKTSFLIQRTSPRRERFTESDSSYSSLRSSQEEPKSNASGFKTLTYIRKRSNSSPRHWTVIKTDPDFKFPFEPTTTKSYLNKAKNKFKTSELPNSFNEDAYEILVGLDANNASNKRVFALDTNELLGQGGLTKIFKVWDLETKQLLAAKVYKPCTTHSLIQNIMTEANNLKYINKFHGFFCLPDLTRILVMDYAPRLSLFHYLYELAYEEDQLDPICLKKKYIAPFTKLQLVYQLLEQVKVLHELAFPEDHEFEGLLHRDIKPENIQVDDREANQISAQLIDFEVAIRNRKDEKNSNECTGTFGYKAPEQQGDKRQPYTKASDLFQLGVTIGAINSKYLYPNAIAEYLAQRKDDFIYELSQETIKKLMPDVFITRKYEVDLSNFELLIEQHIQEIIYKHRIFPTLCELTLSMTEVDPSCRLKGSSLGEEILKLKELERICINLAKNLHERVENALNKQKLLQDLSQLLHNEVGNNPIDLAINNLITSLSSESSEFSSQQTPFSTSI